MARKAEARGERHDGRRPRERKGASPDQREKRMTFFITDSAFRSLRLQSGLFQVSNANADADTPTDELLPESPSALVREAVDFWLDNFGRDANAMDDDERAERMAIMKKAMGKKP